MSETNIPRSFYCNYEQLKELNSFKKEVEAISPYYSEEIQEYLFVNNKEDYINKMFSNNDLIRQLYSKKKIEFLDYISLSIDLKEGTKSIDFYVFDKLNDIEFKIDNKVMPINFIGDEGWGLITLELEIVDGKPMYTVKKLELISLSIDEDNLKALTSLRDKYSLNDWTSLLLHSFGYSSTNLTFIEKITILARAIPYCQDNFSLLEIGSRGTGKSKFYKNLNSKKMMRLTGTPSAASLFYNNSNKKTGNIVNNEVLVIDEIHNMSFDDEIATNFKSYLEEGVFTRGKELHSDCSVVFLGNYDNFNEAFNNPEKILDSLKNNFFKDPAIIDRISFISYGWKTQPYVKPDNAFEGKILQTYLVKIFQELREQDFYSLIEEKISFNGLKERDRKNVLDVVSGLLKLLHPNKKVRDKELIAYMEIAIENLKYRVDLKKYFESSTTSTGKRNKSEYNLPNPVFIPKNEIYKNQLDIINREFILYNYLDLFRSNYSLKDFIPIAEEFELDNSSNTNTNFFPINKTVGKKKDIQLIGDIISIEHPIHENEFLNIATSLTGIYSNEGKVVFYNEFKKRSWTIFSFMANTFEEIGSYSDNYLLLSTKRKTSSIPQSRFGPVISFGTNKKGPDITDFIKENGFIPYYPKNIYSSQHFKHTDYFIHYGNFHLINKINSNIEISSINYIIKEELYEISYYDLQQSENSQNKNNQQIQSFKPLPSFGRPTIRPQENSFGFGQHSAQKTQSFGVFGSPKPELITKSLTINELIDLLEEKTKTSQN